jgi:hypothetical protein
MWKHQRPYNKRRLNRQERQLGKDWEYFSEWLDERFWEKINAWEAKRMEDKRNLKITITI